MNKIIYRLIFIFGCILILTGLLFKIQHWPGSKISLLIGYGLIGFLFTPIYFANKLKKHSIKILKRLDLIGIACLICLSTGSILNILDYRFGYYIALFGFVILILLFIPLLTYVVVQFKENRLRRILILSFSIVYVLWAFYFIFSIINIKSTILDAFILVDRGIELENQNNQIQSNYNDLLVNNKDSINILKLRQKADSIKDYIQSLKIEIVTECSNYNSNDDSLLYDKFFNKKKALELKNLIDDYKNFISNNFNKYIDNEMINKYLSTKVYNSKTSKSWEDEQFNHLPLIAVTTILSKIQFDIINVENEIIKNLKN
jgi:hypothetical protein